mgnify:CR=1 FL=1
MRRANWVSTFERNFISIFLIVIHYCCSDLCSAFGGHMLSLLDVDPINELLTQGRRSKSGKTKTLSQWATKEIRKLKNANAW